MVPSAWLRVRLVALVVAATACAGVTPPAAAATMPTAVNANVGTAGGILGTSDGRFALTVAPSVLSPGSNLGVLEAASAPAGAPALPAGTEAVSPYFQLIGDGLAVPQVATLAYNAAWLGDASPNRLSVYDWIPGTESWAFRPTDVEGISSTARVYIAQPETLVVLVRRAPYADVSPDWWAATSIDAVVAAGVMQGVGAGQFAPEAPLTRAELAKAISLALGISPSAAPTTFQDVPAGAWCAPYVAAVAQAGLIRGLTPTEFAPDAPVTRAQLAVLVTRALNLGAAGGLGFRDAATVPAWAASGVLAAAATGYMTGYPDGTFQPQSDVTRAQAATVLARVIRRQAP